MFGREGSSTLSFGVRFAQFASKATFDVRARPDLQSNISHASYRLSDSCICRISIPITPRAMPRAASMELAHLFHGMVRRLLWAIRKTAKSHSIGAPMRPFCLAGKRRACSIRNPGIIRVRTTLMGALIPQSISIPCGHSGSALRHRAQCRRLCGRVLAHPEFQSQPRLSRRLFLRCHGWRHRRRKSETLASMAPSRRSALDWGGNCAAETQGE